MWVRVPPRLQFIVAGLLGLAFSQWLYPYAGPDNPQHQQFRPWLEARLAPGLYSRDDYVRTLDSVPGLFWRASALILSKSGLDEEAYFRVVHALGTAALFCAIFLLGLELTGSPRGAWMAWGLALLSNHLHFYSLLGHETFFRDRADQTLLAWPFLVLALRDWLAGRGARAWLLAGLAFNLNPFLSLSLSLVFLVAEAPGLKGARREAAAFAVAASPTLLAILRMPHPSVSSREWAALLRQWYPYHYFPSSWPTAQWVYIAVHGFALGSFFFLGLRRPAARRLAIGFLVLWLAYAFFAEILPWRPAIELQAFRLDVLAILLSLVGAAAVMDRLARLGPGGWAWCGLLGAALANPHRTLLPLGLIVPIAAYWWLRPQRAGRLDGFSRAYLVSLAVLSLIRLAAGFSLSVLYPLESALLVFAFCALVQRPGSRPTAAAALVLGGAITLLELAGSRGSERRAVSADPAARAKRIVSAWLRSSTPVDALVLAVPYFDDLRLSSRRSQVGEYMDGAAMQWDPDFGPVWRDRMAELGCRLDRVWRSAEPAGRERFPLLSRAASNPQDVRLLSVEEQAALVSKYRPDIVVSPYPFSAPGLQNVFSSAGILVYRVEKGRIHW